MHFYQFHIGDYQNDTAHLDLMEDLAYRRLLDLYFKNEGPIPDDIQRVSKLIRMRSHCECIADVLQEFFERTPDGWKNHRAEEELQRVYKKSEKARKAAENRWKGERGKKPEQKQEVNADALQTHSERNADGMLPMTHNPIPNNNPPVSPPGESTSKSEPSDKPKRAKRKTQIPKTFELTLERKRKAVAYWHDRGRLDLNAETEFEQFVAHHRAKGSTMADWEAAWQTWYANAVKFNRPSLNPGGHGHATSQRPDNSAAGRVRENIRREREQWAREDAQRAAEDPDALEHDDQHVWSQMG